MTVTTIANIALDIEKVNSYSIQETTAKSNLIESGIMVRTPEFDALADSTGKVIKMPYWNDLTGNDEILPTDGTTALALNGVTSAYDQAVINHRGAGFAVQDMVEELAKVMANDPNADPMKVIASRLGVFWALKHQTTLLSILKGIFADSSMSGLVSDITGQSTAATRTINADTIIDAEGKLGDMSGGLTAMMVHSATERKMRKDDLIDYIKPSDGGKELAYYAGKRLVINDLCPVGVDADAGKYTSYLFGQGAFAYGEATAKNPIETQRKAGEGVDELYTRRKFILHPRGVAFDGTPTGVSPTNTEFETGSNWTRKYDVKNIRIVAFKHLLA